jgi:hypothetical protein
MFHSLKWECGSKIIYQSHQNLLTARSLEMLVLMANNRDILDEYPQEDGKKIIKTPNTYLEGIKKFQSIFLGKDPELK